jgi:hypothetical protein
LSSNRAQATARERGRAALLLTLHAFTRGALHVDGSQRRAAVVAALEKRRNGIDACAPMP